MTPCPSGPAGLHSEGASCKDCHHRHCTRCLACPRCACTSTRTVPRASHARKTYHTLRVVEMPDGEQRPLESFLAEQATRAEQRAQELGLAQAPLVSLRLRRRVRTMAQQAQIAPGLFGQIVQWGDGTWMFPTVVLVECQEIRAWLARRQARRGA